ncbi:LOW QUALITY PROTEIN: lanC-like protein 3 [Pomacea canaliculata]|uniref:LOW QUALITY PROTEIN: lanC-like protein 3 n=1 Tax=Pomacea canaliculata TaxID=400727 RepID=UPI000D7341BD|nr:LOW QUALITY PROTEIN: lanC-like protein 3 [Pomacea canaliculata]
MTMSKSKRNFNNDLADYKKGDKVTIDVKQWKTIITSLIEHRITDEMPPILARSEGSMYVGNTGLAYMYFHISMLDVFQEERWEYLRCGQEYFNIALEYTRFYLKDEELGPSLMLGAAGTYMVGALISNALDDTKTCQKCVDAYLALGKVCIKPHFLKQVPTSCSLDELATCVASLTCSAGWANRSSTTAAENHVSHDCGDWARVFKNPQSSSPLMYAYYGTEYLGASHGLTSILLMLLSFPEYLRAEPSAEQHIQETVNYLLSLQQPDFNFPPSIDEVKGSFHRPESEQLVHWCHGAPGMVYLFAKAYRFWGDEKYLQACIECGEIAWKKGLLRKGPGLCHGVAGCGYVFLLLHRLTGDVKFLHRSLQFARFVLSPDFKQYAKIPDSPFSLFEGWGGAVCFMADLLQPEKAAFPLLDVLEF